MKIIKVGEINLTKSKLDVFHANTAGSGSVLRINGDGCVFPHLNRDQVTELLTSLIEWINKEDESCSRGTSG